MFFQSGISEVMIGVDEVGRGAWAGPLLVCAVRLHEPITGLRDSKKLTANRRKVLSLKIIQVADIGYGWVTSVEIDSFGLAAALRTATASALGALNPSYEEEIIIDGSVNFAPQFKGTITAVRADDIYPAVSAASIVAKVARDAYMTELAVDEPNYAFEQHMGYGTAQHALSLLTYGASTQHRLSFKIPTQQ